MKKIIEKMPELKNLDDIKVVVGWGTVCSEWHFDEFPTNIFGVWMWRKDLARWFFKKVEDKVWWMVLTDDEVRFKERSV